MTSNLPITSIKIDGGTQSRERLNQETIRNYAEVLQNNGTLPAITVFYDGKTYWLSDGYHRYMAARVARQSEIECDIRQGDKRAAILFSCGANHAHGLPRTNADKRRAVMVLLGDIEWSQYSSREIARICNVSESMVRFYRGETDPEEPNPEVRKLRTSADLSKLNARVGKDGKVYPAITLAACRNDHEAGQQQLAPIATTFIEDDSQLEPTWELKEDQLIIQTSWDSISLSLSQALMLYDYLSGIAYKLKRFANES